MRKLIIVLAVLAIAATSCKKDENDLNKTGNGILKTTILTNPYDYVGNYHNDALDYIINSNNINELENEIEENRVNAICTLIEEYQLNNYSTSVNNPISENSGLLDISDNAYAIYYDDTEYDLSNFTEEFNSYLAELTSIMNHTSYSMSEKIIQFQNTEQDILMSPLNNDVEQAILLVSISVAKSSYAYWMNFMANYGFKNTNESPGAAIANSDIAGAISGAIAGGIIGGLGGSWAPGPGTITGAISGAVIGGAWGAVTSSALTGIICIFD